MVNVLLEFNWTGVLLAVCTIIMIGVDRAFKKRTRIDFQIALVLCCIISIVSSHIDYEEVVKSGMLDNLLHVSVNILRLIILFFLIAVSGISNKIINMAGGCLLGIDLLFSILNWNIACEFVFILFTVLILVTTFLNINQDDRADYVFFGSILVIILFSALAEIVLEKRSFVDNALCMFTIIYYYYLVMKVYKRDHLTGLLLRHNLNFEMKDIIEKEYDIALIDVDNFKLINDKYGHDRGDEVLVTIVEAIKKQLPKKSRMFRFGGDELVVIGYRPDKYDISQALEQANTELEENELRISYGVIRHGKGQSTEEVLTLADKAMYENKRLLKSEDIWDDMTGLYNYKGFLEELESVKKAVKDDNRVICLVGFDIERLQNINMAYGYTEGNLVIATLARVLKKCLRGRDFIGHLGSDEFAVAIECQNENDTFVDAFIRQVQEELDGAYEFADKDYTAKINVAQYIMDKADDISAEEHVNNVLYIKQEDKENRRKTGSADGEQDYNKQDEQLVMDILDHNKLKYAFQPIVSSKDGSIVAYESLMRSDTETMVSPLKILKYAEKNRRSYEVEKYTFFNVLSKFKNDNAFPENARVFINSIPGFFLKDEDYDKLKDEYGDLFKRMVIEITEQREIDDDDLASINNKGSYDGFNLAIDDYGSGCSNTNSLLRYMPQVVKLDRLLIAGIDRNAKKQFFVNSIISFARENDMLILAEGVETERELKTVIRLGVDLIQGYITSKPSFDIVTEIPKEIKKIIIDENLKVRSNQRVVYTVADDCDLSTMHLAMEDYTKINISASNVTLRGSDEYVADMVIRVKEGTDCYLKLIDVRLNSVDDEPCIDIGEGANLTLYLEGHNSINSKGIHVPESSTLTIEGPGTLEASVKGHQCYAIGTNNESVFGKIILRGSGSYNISVDGEECIGIGGGVAGDDSLIDIHAGRFDMKVAGVDAVGIGCYKGRVPIVIRDFGLITDFRVNTGVVIGSWEGPLDVDIRNFEINISGSGAKVGGIGSIEKTSGKVYLDAGSYNVELRGQNINLLGCNEVDDLSIGLKHIGIDLLGEGDNVLGIGSKDKKTFVDVIECGIRLVINSSSPIGLGSSKEGVHFQGPVTSVIINGQEEVI